MSKSLPSVSTPKLALTLPLSGKKIFYRPFVMKEKKAMLLAKESEEWDSILATLKDVVLACTDGEVDITKIPVTDVGYLFIQMRVQAIGPTLQFMTVCKNCKEEFQINYDIASIKIQKEWNPEAMITDEIGIRFRAPTFDIMKFASGKDADPEMFIASLIEQVFDANEVYESQSVEEYIEWLNTFDDSQMAIIKSKLDEIPTLEQDIDYKCPKCSHEHKIHLEGLSDFF